jgi:Uma2 family endonuclease
VDEGAVLCPGRSVLPDRPRVELIEGEILQVSPHNYRHRTAIAFSTTVLVKLFGSTHVVQVQLPLDLGTYSQPEPDFSIVPIRQAREVDLHPTCHDLVIEISDSPLAFDRRKGALYAQANIPEYWLVNLRKGVLEAQRDPKEGKYRSTTLHRPSESLSSLFQPGVLVPLESFFPPR